jgi:uncharacterized integral membrane protein
MSRFLVTPLLALWIIAIALLSVQNATPVSLQFLGLRSVQMPLGVAISFCAAAGVLGTALLLRLGKILG